MLHSTIPYREEVEEPTLHSPWTKFIQSWYMNNMWKGFAWNEWWGISHGFCIARGYPNTIFGSILCDQGQKYIEPTSDDWNIEVSETAYECQEADLPL